LESASGRKILEVHKPRSQRSKEKISIELETPNGKISRDKTFLERYKSINEPVTK